MTFTVLQGSLMFGVDSVNAAKLDYKAGGTVVETEASPGKTQRDETFQRN